MDWIRCGDSLPLFTDYYLVTFVNDRDQREVGIMKFDRGQWIYHTEKVIAWADAEPYSGPA